MSLTRHYEKWSRRALPHLKPNLNSRISSQSFHVFSVFKANMRQYAVQGCTNKSGRSAACTFHRSGSAYKRSPIRYLFKCYSKIRQRHICSFGGVYTDLKKTIDIFSKNPAPVDAESLKCALSANCQWAFAELYWFQSSHEFMKEPKRARMCSCQILYPQILHVP